MADPQSGRVVFERQRYPIVVLRIPEHGTVQGVHEWYDTLESMLEAAERPVALVHDLRKLALFGATAGNRAAVAERTQRLIARGLHAKIAADARIVANSLVAGAVTAVSWLTGAMPWPQATFTDEQDALDWADMCLQRRRAAR